MLLSALARSCGCAEREAAKTTEAPTATVSTATLAYSERARPRTHGVYGDALNPEARFSFETLSLSKDPSRR